MAMVPARYVMHGLLGAAYGMNILCRNSVSFIVPFIVEVRERETPHPVTPSCCC